MAKVLQNFLIGVGLDTEKYDKGAKGVESSLFRMRTLVDFTGAAITGAFAVVGSSAVRAGERLADFSLATEGLKTSPDYIYAYGRALAAMGGDANAAVTAINSAEDAIDQFKLKGTFGPFEGAAFAGVRDELYSLMHAADGGELLRGLAGVMPSLNKGQQRLIQDSFNLPPEVMRSLRGGRAEFDANIARAAELSGNFGKGTAAALEYNRAMAELETRFQDIGDTLAEKVLPGFTGIVDSLGGFIDKNRDLMKKGIEVVGDNPGAAILAGSGAAAAGGGALLQRLGLKGLGGLASRAGHFGVAAGAGMLAYDEFKDKPWGDWWDTSVNSVEDSWDRFTGRRDYSNLPDAPYGSAVPVVDEYGMPIEFAGDGVMPVNQMNYHEPEYQITETPSSGFVQPYIPVYAGGEVSNSEAASVSPEIIMLKEQREQADRPIAPQRVTVQNHLEANLTLDGRALESKMTEVIERREREALIDFQSSESR